jgi:hypothetical protein
MVGANLVREGIAASEAVKAESFAAPRRCRWVRRAIRSEARPGRKRSMKTCMLLLAIGLPLPATDVGAANCYRLRCPSSQSCQSYAVDSSGPCCCNVNCQGGPGEVSCSCTTSCSRSCSEACPSCPCGESGEGGFVYSPAAAERLRSEHPLTALLLANLRSPGTNQVRSTVAEGRASLGGGPELAYRVVLTATEGSVTAEFVFERVGAGPLPENVRVEVDSLGRALTTPLSDEEARRVAARAALVCGRTGS